MRHVILLASVLIQVCIGGLYAWSSFVPALQDAYGLSAAQTQLVFGGLIAVFTLSMVYAGRLLNRRGPRLVAGAGGLLFGSGYVIASLSGGSLPVILLGISLLVGIGTGFCYVCALTMCVRWFPAQKGLATGIAVAGFGGGAILLSFLVEMLFERDMDVLRVFRWLGVSYGLAIFGAALLLKAPEAKEDANVRAAPALGILLQDRIFWALVLGMFCGTFAGLLVIGNLKPMALASGLSPVSATAAISAFALGNTGGRIAWGWVADRTGYGAIPLSLAFLAVAMAGLVPLSARAGYYAVLSALIGFGFGACFVVYASQTASRYGLDRVGSVYPLVFLAYGLAGIIGPWVGGVVYDTTTSHTPAVIASVAVVLAGLLASSWLLRSATRCTCAEIAVEKVMTTEKETAE